MRISFVIAFVIAGLVSGCVTAEQKEAQAATALERLAAVEAEAGDEKVSLNKSLDEHGTVTLLDDETGEEKLVCKYMKATGTRFGRKVCATPREWEEKRIESQEEAARIQRNMDARCPGGCS